MESSIATVLNQQAAFEPLPDVVLMRAIYEPFAYVGILRICHNALWSFASLTTPGCSCVA